MNIAKWQLIGLLFLTAIATHYAPKLVLESSCDACRREMRAKNKAHGPGKLPILGDGKNW